MLTIIIAVVGFLVDRVAKILTLRYVKPVGSISVIDGVFSFTYVENTGAAHGLFQGKVWILAAVSAVVSVVIIWYVAKNYKKLPTWLRVAFALILAGALGNLFDRVVYGYVIDMMQVTFINYPVFNPADNMLVVGVVILCIFILFIDTDVFGLKKKKQQLPEEEITEKDKPEN